MKVRVLLQLLTNYYNCCLLYFSGQIRTGKEEAENKEDVHNGRLNVIYHQVCSDQYEWKLLHQSKLLWIFQD